MFDISILQHIKYDIIYVLYTDTIIGIKLNLKTVRSLLNDRN